MGNIEVIDFNNCTSERMKEEGFGGIRVMVTKKENVTYVVKPQNLNQTLNEIMAQIMLKSLGLTPIEYVFVEIDGTHYGALKYIDNLTRVTDKRYKLLSREKKIEFLKHLFLNFFLANQDICGEIYVTPGGDVVSLDYGEAGISVSLERVYDQPSELHRLFITFVNNKTSTDLLTTYTKNYVDTAVDRYVDDSITKEDICGVVLSMVESIVNADNSEYEAFLYDLDDLHGELIAYLYQQHLNGVIDTSEYIIEHFDKIIGKI